MKPKSKSNRTPTLTLTLTLTHIKTGVLPKSVKGRFYADIVTVDGEIIYRCVGSSPTVAADKAKAWYLKHPEFEFDASAEADLFAGEAFQIED